MVTAFNSPSNPLGADGKPDRNAAGKSLFYFSAPPTPTFAASKTVHELKDRSNLIALNDLYDRMRDCGGHSPARRGCLP